MAHFQPSSQKHVVAAYNGLGTNDYAGILDGFKLKKVVKSDRSRRKKYRKSKGFLARLGAAITGSRRRSRRNYGDSYEGILDNIRRRRSDRKSRSSARKMDRYDKCVEKKGKNDSRCKAILKRAKAKDAAAAKIAAKTASKGKRSTYTATRGLAKPKTLTSGGSSGAVRVLTAASSSITQAAAAAGVSTAEYVANQDYYEAAGYTTDDYDTDEGYYEDEGPNYLLLTAGGVAVLGFGWLIYTKVIKKPRVTVGT